MQQTVLEQVLGCPGGKNTYQVTEKAGLLQLESLK